MDASARIRFEFALRPQLHDLDGTLHGARFFPWGLELVVDLGYGERSPRDQQRRNHSPSAWDYDHPVPRTDVTLGGMPSYDGNCQLGGTCYAVRTGGGSMGDPPNRYVSLAPPFSGATGTASYIERAQDHPSWLQDNASSREAVVDGWPAPGAFDGHQRRRNVGIGAVVSPDFDNHGWR